MAEQALPRILILRAEKILNTRVVAAYKLYDAVTKCVLSDGSVRYVDLDKRTEVPATMIKIKLEEWGKEDTEKLTGKPEPKIDLDVEIKDEGGIANELPVDDIKKVSEKATKKKSTQTKKK